MIADPCAPTNQRKLARAECAKVAHCLHHYGVVLARDPRCPSNDNDRFLDLLEAYYAQPPAAKLQDARPDLHYQVGVLPEGREVPACQSDPECLRAIAAQPPEHRARVPRGPDPKWRFHWRIGAGPKPGSEGATRFRRLNAPPVVPAAFAAEWADVMDGWGGQLVRAARTVAGMAEAAFGLEAGAFRARMEGAPHLLAPTGSDLAAHGAVGTVFAGYHYDLNFLTIHGRARFPGLAVWLRDGRRVPVQVPEGCLLLQAGKQLEWMTGGHVRAGMHEVVSDERTTAAAALARREGRSLWRVSSTLFSHLASDATLAPQGPFATPEALARYPPTLAGHQVQGELNDRVGRREAYYRAAQAGGAAGGGAEEEGAGVAAG